MRGDALDLGQPRARAAPRSSPTSIRRSTSARPSARAPGEARIARAQGRVAYEDRWPSLEAYVAWLEPRVAAARDALGADGTLWLHLDHRAVHEAKAACDRVFGRRAFLGEIVWATGNGARGARRGPAVTHQTLLLYARRPRLRVERARSEPARALRPDEPLHALQRGATPRAAATASAPSPAARTATTPTRGARSAACGPTARR